MKIGTRLIGSEPLNEMFYMTTVFARLTPRKPAANFRVGNESQAFGAELQNSAIDLLLIIGSILNRL